MSNDKPSAFNKYEVLRDFTYRHSHQDPSHGDYHLKKGQIIELRPYDQNDFMPDRSNLKLLESAGQTLGEK